MELTHRTQTSLQAELDPRSQAQKDAASTIYSALYDWQTRVILLHPAANFSEPLVAQLRTVELLHGAGVVLATGKRRRIGYTALSYCWGPPEFEKEIELYGKMYPITQNLYDALLHLRNERTPVTLWIDALCTSSLPYYVVGNFLTAHMGARYQSMGCRRAISANFQYDDYLLEGF